MNISLRKSLALLTTGSILVAISAVVSSNHGISPDHIYTLCAAAIAATLILHTKNPERYSQTTWLIIIGFIAVNFHIGVAKEGGLNILLVIYAITAMCSAVMYGLASLKKRANRESSLSQ